MIVGVYEATRLVIHRNRIEFRQKAIFDVLPDAHSTAAFRWNESGRFDPASPDEVDGHLIFAGYDESHNLVGLAIEAQGMGYQDVVRVLYGYSFDSQAIVGLRVLQSRETPGLGDRIETEEQFLRNFDNLDLRLRPDGTELAHRIEFVKLGEKTAPWQIDGISGATITSRATADMLRESSARWVPLVHRHRADFVYREREQ